MSAIVHDSVIVKASNMIEAIKAYELKNPIHIIYKITEQ